MDKVLLFVTLLISYWFNFRAYHLLANKKFFRYSLIFFNIPTVALLFLLFFQYVDSLHAYVVSSLNVLLHITNARVVSVVFLATVSFLFLGILRLVLKKPAKYSFKWSLLFFISSMIFWLVANFFVSIPCDLGCID